MDKKCVICGGIALFKIKDSSDFYCKRCALENFGDLDYLQTVEEEALRLKQLLKYEKD